MENQTIKSIIIDDDPFIRDLLQDKLDQYVPDVQVVATASSGKEGIEMIRNFHPEMVFLDVEMADMTGFEMLAQLEKIEFQTIFITSYSHYAIKAIRFNALDYLVKPIDLGELKKAIQRYKEKRASRQAPTEIHRALKNMNARTQSEMEITLQTQEGPLHLALNDIIRIEGERNYSYIFLSNGKKKLVSKTVGDLEELLADKGFFRCHKSHLVNGTFIDPSGKKVHVQMKDGTIIPIARRRKDDFWAWFRQE